MAKFTKNELKNLRSIVDAIKVKDAEDVYRILNDMIDAWSAPPGGLSDSKAQRYFNRAKAIGIDFDAFYDVWQKAVDIASNYAPHAKTKGEYLMWYKNEYPKLKSKIYNEIKAKCKV